FAFPGNEPMADRALRTCLDQKRPADQWCLQRYATEIASKSRFFVTQGILGLDDAIPQEDGPIKATFTTDAEALRAAMDDAKPAGAYPEGLAAAAHNLIDAILPIAGSRHLICLSTSSSVPVSVEQMKA